MVLLVVLFAAAVVTVPLAGGRLSALATLRFRAHAALLAGLGLQVLIGVVVPDGPPALLGTAHVASYVLTFVFLVANRRIPGMWLVGLGGLANLLVIALNGGVMPASPSAWQAAGLPAHPDGFSNSAVLVEPRLAFLGDVFAIPHPWPLANVFSAGDVLLLLGGALALHRLCGSRLVPSGYGQFRELRHHRGFVNLWLAQGVSNLGDWTYSLAVYTALAGRADAAQLLATLLIVQVAPAALVSLLGGPIIDRAHRGRLMVAADICRAAAVASLLLGTGTPSTAQLYVVAAVLGLCGALFQPAMQASLPNLVPRERLVAANALVSATYHLAVMVGPILGGLLVTHIGGRPAFGLNAASFLLSAVLVLRVGLRRHVTREQVEQPLRALAEGLRYSATNPLVRGVLLTLGCVVFAAALRTPLEPLFVLQTLGREPSALGIVGGAWGFGMLLGSLAAPAAARRWARERLLWLGIGVVGVSVLAASRATVLSPVLVFWLVAGGGNALGSIAYESLLQERTPDALRGRVMAATEAVIQAAFLIGAVTAGWVGGQLGLRGSYALSGMLFLGAALLSRVVVPEPRAARAAGRQGPVPPPGPVELPVLVVEPDLERAKTLCAALLAAGVAVDRASGVDDVVFAVEVLPPPPLVVVDPATRHGRVVLELLAATPRWDGLPVVAFPGEGQPFDAQLAVDEVVEVLGVPVVSGFPVPAHG